MDSVTKKIIMDITGFLDISKNNIKIESLDGNTRNLAELLQELDGDFVNIKIETTKIVR